MGILDWFKNRSAPSAAKPLPDEDVAQAIDKAVTLTNPRLKLLGSCEETLRGPVEKCVVRLREAMSALPPPIRVSENDWAGEPVLRAIFARAPEVSDALGRSRNLRTFLDKYARIEQAFIILGATCDERQTHAPSLQGGARQDIAQTVMDFSDPTVRICGQTDAEVKRLLAMRSFEYLVAQAMTEISEAREGRRELEDSRKLIQAKLRLLQQQGPGLGAVFDAGPPSVEQRQLEARLRENERQMEEHGSARSALEYELECLRGVLENSQDYLEFEARRIRLSTLNVILDENSADAGADVAFTLAKFSGTRKMQRAFVIGRIDRSDMPLVRLDIANAERFL
jgi:hypothetical protein